MERVISPDPSTPAVTGEPRTAPRALPDDLLREASHRLGIMSLMGAILWVTAWTLNEVAMKVMTGQHPLAAGLQESDYIAIVSAIFSILLYRYTRKSKRSPAFMLDLGLWYLVLTAFAIGFMWHGEAPPAEHGPMPIFPKLPTASRRSSERRASGSRSSSPSRS